VGVTALTPSFFSVKKNTCHHYSPGSRPFTNLHLSTTTTTTEDAEATATETSTTTSTTGQSSSSSSSAWTEDGFVFGLEGSGLQRPTGRTSQIVVEGDSLETTNWQRALVSATFVGHAVFATTALSQMWSVHNHDITFTTLEATLLAGMAWILADFGSGVLHWSVDNYGNGKTPVMGSIIAAFQGHHAAPWTITERGFCNNVYKLCLPFGLFPMTMESVLHFNPAVTFFLTCFCTLEILSQEFHKWSHQLPSETPNWVNQLQAIGVTVGRKPHAAHHLAPYEGNYCIISGVCNPWLDASGFFRRLEHTVYHINGVESNAWKLDPELRQRTLSGDYSLPSSSTASNKQ
jgi:ubiquitin-conjugating enzyme E2 variant